MKHIQEITNRYVLPTIEEKTAYGYKRLDPYTKLFEERIIFLGQAIDDTVANDVMAQLLTLESMDPDRDISIYINSPGGSFTALTAIYDTMQFVRPDITTICLGQAASAAAIILAGGTKGVTDLNIHESLSTNLHLKVGDRHRISKSRHVKSCACVVCSRQCLRSIQIKLSKRLKKISNATRFLLQLKQLNTELSIRLWHHERLSLSHN
jgi:ATP-dependent Clp endopeptidase proteolytic subunit ClpP